MNISGFALVTGAGKSSATASFVSFSCLESSPGFVASLTNWTRTFSA